MTSFVALTARVGAFAVLTALALPLAAQEDDAPLPEPPPLAGAAPGQAVAPPPVVNPGEPAIGRLQIFEDWAVGCDNRLSCSAVSLVPEGAGTAYSVLVTIQRAGGPEGAGLLRLIAADQLRGKIDLIADNNPLKRIKVRGDTIEITGPEAVAMIRTLGSSYAFELREKQRVIDAPSLRGLPDALRYMDEQQGRVGSQGALAAIGDARPDMARPVPPEPVVTAGGAVASDAPPPALTPEEQTAARRLAVCEGRLENDYPLETHDLDGAHALVLLPCNAGAYNVSAVPLIGSGGPGHWQFRIARFDHAPGFTGDPGTPPLIVNARWNPVKRELSSFAKGRGLGDCGTAETYKWDGDLFRLTEARAMPVCRGAWEWPVLYSAGAAQG